MSSYSSSVGWSSRASEKSNKSEEKPKMPTCSSPEEIIPKDFSQIKDTLRYIGQAYSSRLAAIYTSEVNENTAPVENFTLTLVLPADNFFTAKDTEIQNSKVLQGFNRDLPLPRNLILIYVYNLFDLETLCQQPLLYAAIIFYNGNVKRKPIIKFKENIIGIYNMKSGILDICLENDTEDSVDSRLRILELGQESIIKDLGIMMKNTEEMKHNLAKITSEHQEVKGLLEELKQQNDERVAENQGMKNTLAQLIIENQEVKGLLVELIKQNDERVTDNQDIKNILNGLSERDNRRACEFEDLKNLVESLKLNISDRISSSYSNSTPKTDEIKEDQ